MHYITNGGEKYIWYPATSEGMYFNLEEGLRELHASSTIQATGAAQIS